VKSYAKIFVDQPEGSLGLVFEVQDAVDARQNDIVVEGQDVEIDIRRNPDAGQAEDFIGFPMLVEVYPKVEGATSAVIKAVESIILALDAAGFSFATAADFEDLLPGRGRNVTF